MLGGSGLSQCNSLCGIKGIVFDLDDTLYLQAHYKRSGFRILANWLSQTAGIERQLTLHILENILVQYGPSYPKMFNLLALRLNLPPSIIRPMIQLFQQHKPTIQCFPHIKRTLIQLRKKYQVGILTDGRRDVQRKKFYALGLAPLVDAVIFSDDLGLSKPAPALFEWYEKKFDVPGWQLIYVGDNPQKDFLGANQRNWMTIRVLTGEHRHRQVTDERQAKIELPAVTDLSAWLEQWES